MKTADPEFMRAINRFHVMDAIRRFGPISRVEIAERTDLSPPTVSAITAALIEDALIVPRAIGALRDATRGRPRVMLELNPNAAYVVGVKLAPVQITVAATDFRADVLNMGRRHMGAWGGGDDAPRTLRRAMEHDRPGAPAPAQLSRARRK